MTKYKLVNYNTIQKIVNDKAIAQSERPITKDELCLLLNEYILTGHRNWLIKNNVVEYLDITEYTKIYYYQPGNHLDKVLIGSFPYRMFMNQKGMLEVAGQLILAVEDLRKHGIK